MMHLQSAEQRSLNKRIRTKRKMRKMSRTNIWMEEKDC